VTIPGLALGRTVYYTPDKALDDVNTLSDLNYDMVLFVQGRVARIDNLETGFVTVACDVPPESKTGYSRAFTYFANNRPYDPSGGPGTWRFPPRV